MDDVVEVGHLLVASLSAFVEFGVERGRARRVMVARGRRVGQRWGDGGGRGRDGGHGHHEAGRGRGGR